MTDKQLLHRLSAENSNLKALLWESRRQQNMIGNAKQLEIYKDKLAVISAENMKKTEEIKELRQQVKKMEVKHNIAQQKVDQMYYEAQDDKEDPVLTLPTTCDELKMGQYVRLKKYRKAMAMAGDLAGKVRRLTEELEQCKQTKE